MNFLSGAITMAKSAAEAGASGLSAVTSKVTEVTGVEMPASLPLASAQKTGQNSTVGGGGGGGGGYGRKSEPEEEEEKQQKKDDENLGRLEVKLDYNFERQTLAITVLQCENLPAMDIGGTSDPYVKLYIMPDKKKKFCTKKFKKTLNPVFNETFKFEKLPFSDVGNRIVVFSVFDHDAVGADDQIGEVKLPLANIDLAADNNQMWFDIKTPPKNYLGEVCLSLRYKPQSKPPVLVIVVVECRNLKPMDIGGASDPYVKVNHMFKGKRVKKYKTVVQPANLNPYWNTSFKIPVNQYEMKETELQIYVNDYDKFGGNDTIGNVLFSVKDQGSGRQHWCEAISQPKTNVTKWHELQPPPEDDK